MNQHIAEKINIAQGFLPVAMNAGANAGDWVSLKNYRRCAIVFFKAVGTNGDDPTITILQAQNVAGSGTTKAVNINRVDKKQAATNLLAVGQFTKSTPASPASNDTFSTNTWTNSDLAQQAAIVVIDISVDDLDVDGGFDCIQASIADVGTNAQLGAMLYLLHDPVYQTDPLPTGIAD